MKTLMKNTIIPNFTKLKYSNKKEWYPRITIFKKTSFESGILATSAGLMAPFHDNPDDFRAFKTVGM